MTPEQSYALKILADYEVKDIDAEIKHADKITNDLEYYACVHGKSCNLTAADRVDLENAVSVMHQMLTRLKARRASLIASIVDVDASDV